MPSAARKCHGSVVGSASACATQAASHATVPSVCFFGWKMPLLLRVWGRRTTGGDGAGAATPEEPLSISGEEDVPAGESGGTVRVGEDRSGVTSIDGPGDEDSVTCEAAGSGDSAAGPAGSADNSAGSASPGDSEALQEARRRTHPSEGTKVGIGQPFGLMPEFICDPHNHRTTDRGRTSVH